jgi:long-chain acyl-CoA synthetase
VAADTIPHRLLHQARTRPSTPAYYAKVGGTWQPTTWRRYADEVRIAARALIGLGFPRGGKVAILGFNRPEWSIFDHAAMMAGGAPAGIYTTCSPDEVQYIIHHSESFAVLVEDDAQYQKVRSRRDQLPLLKWIVAMRGAVLVDAGNDVIPWDEFMERGGAVDDIDLDRRIDAIEEAELATLIYTSGTTGPPKGVMLSHRNLAWTSQTLIDQDGARDGDCSISYLPLSHVAEQMATILMPATTGSTVYYAESIEKLPDNIKEVRPTVFFGVPRIWEKFHAGITAKLAEVKGGKKRLIDWARKTAGAVHAKRDRGEPVGKLLELQYKLADRLVLGKLKAALGMDRARMCISGAAPIAKDVLEFFSSIDLPIREIYGQSEDTGPTSFNLPGRTRIGTVGPALAGVEVKIADDGEILVRGPNVFLGYFKEPEATAETLVDGWLCSGDLGQIDAGGFLSITGRKKEIIITAGGKNIAPKNIEAGIKESPLVAEAVVIGDRRKFLSALIALDDAAAKKLMSDRNLSGAPHECAEIVAAVQQTVDRVNEQLARVEQVKKFTILSRPFSLDTGELTPTLKIKRKVVDTNFAREIEAMYRE